MLVTRGSFLFGLSLLCASAWAGETTGVVFSHADQSPMPQLKVLATQDTGAVVEGLTDIDGAFVLDLPDGTWTLQVTGPTGFQFTSPTFLSDEAGAELLFTLGTTPETSSVRLEANKTPTKQALPAPQVSEDAITMKGMVTDSDNTPIEGARLFVRGQHAQALTDKRGTFKLELPPGTYEITAIKQGFASRTFANVTIPLDGELILPMVKAGLTSEALTISAPRIEGGTASLLTERREVNVVADVLGAEQMSKSGDSDAAGALSRVTGLTVVDGKFVFVRGLGERYSASLLNGANLPSPDPERRVVPLDLIPVGLLESIVIQKTFSPDMPAEFGGGVIALRSRNVPEEFDAKLSFSTGYLSGTTFQTGLQSSVGPTDWLGFGSRHRALPTSVSAASDSTPLEETDMFSSRGYTAEELESYGEMMDASRWQLQSEQFDPIWA